MRGQEQSGTPRIGPTGPHIRPLRAGRRIRRHRAAPLTRLRAASGTRKWTACRIQRPAGHPIRAEAGRLTRVEAGYPMRMVAVHLIRAAAAHLIPLDTGRCRIQAEPGPGTRPWTGRPASPRPEHRLRLLARSGTRRWAGLLVRAPTVSWHHPRIPLPVLTRIRGTGPPWDLDAVLIPAPDRIPGRILGLVPLCPPTAGRPPAVTPSPIRERSRVSIPVPDPAPARAKMLPPTGVPDLVVAQYPSSLIRTGWKGPLRIVTLGVAPARECLSAGCVVIRIWSRVLPR